MNPTFWGMNWAWGLPLIVLTVVLHAGGLRLIGNEINSRLSSRELLGHRSFAPVFAIGATALSVTLLHTIEVVMWAVTYRLVGASADSKAAMLYSLSAMTSYGHANIYLEPRWQMMGALEALNGWILFGLTTAFLFMIFEKTWPHTRAERP
jgi:hypothetical protein